MAFGAGGYTPPGGGAPSTPAPGGYGGAVSPILGVPGGGMNSPSPYGGSGPYGGGGGGGPISPGAITGGASAGGGGGGFQSSLQGPPAPNFAGGGGGGGGGQWGNQYGDPNLAANTQTGQGLMDPNSDYYKQLNEGMRSQIGDESAAAQRAAALRASQGGMGTGGSAELLETQGDIGRAGLNAMGDASANLRMQAPIAGAQINASTFNPQVQYNQLNERSAQFGAGMAQGNQQFAAGMGQQQQGMAQQDAQFWAGLDADTAAQQSDQQMQMYMASLGGF